MRRFQRWGVALAAALLCALMVAAASAAYSTLRYGSRGTAVAQLQLGLTSLGYDVGATDGKYGAMTEQAVRRFQRDQGLKVDGVAGDKTQSLLFAMVGQPTSTQRPVTTPTPAVVTAPPGTGLFGGNYSTLRKGMSGSRVLILQQALNSLGFSCGTADGSYGGLTYNAVVRFQRAWGLTADGAAGPKTLRQIEQAVQGTPVVTPTPVIITPAPTATPAGTVWTAPARTLRLGSTGQDVASLQARLQSLGWFSGLVSGNYGTDTMTAVTAFQRACGLYADGVAGPKTYARLAAWDAPSTLIIVTPTPVPVPTATPVPVPTPTPQGTVWTAPARTLRLGSTGSDVVSLQARLQMLGWYAGSLSGTYDSATEAAVTAFQRACGLYADGVAGAKTYARLAADSAPVATVTATPAPVITQSPQPIPTATPSITTTLRRGSTGPAVTRMQAALALLDYRTTTYGTYDAKTAAAVTSFQSKNGLSADGIAGPATLALLYSGHAVRGDYSAGIGENVGKMSGPSVSQLKLLHWFNDVKPSMKSGQTMLVYDPATGLAWTVRNMSLGRHADVEPLTATDTAIQYRAFGNMQDWGPKPVYIQLPNGTWTVATMHNVAHGSQTIRNNDFDGQNCIHFLRDMEECRKNDPNYGVSNQETLRAFWQSLTGQTVPD